MVCALLGTFSVWVRKQRARMLTAAYEYAGTQRLRSSASMHIASSKKESPIASFEEKRATGKDFGRSLALTGLLRFHPLGRLLSDPSQRASLPNIFETECE